MTSKSNLINARFPNRWIGRGGPVQWPPRSPDLTPMDFFLWGEMKRLVYSTPVPTEADLVARVAAAALFITHTPGIFERTRQSLVRRCHLCVEVNGGIFEQRL